MSANKTYRRLQNITALWFGIVFLISGYVYVMKYAETVSIYMKYVELRKENDSLKILIKSK
jgi:hypothetical protein